MDSGQRPTPQEVADALSDSLDELVEGGEWSLSRISRAMGIGRDALRKYTDEPDNPGTRYNPIQILRWVADHAPKGRERMARLLGINLTEEEADPHLNKRLELMRRAYRASAADTPSAEALSVLLQTLEVQVRAVEREAGDLEM